MNWNTTDFNTNASAKRLAVARGGDITVWPGVSGATAYSTDQVNHLWPYVVLVKITARASGNDTIQAAFFNSGRAGHGILPVNEADIMWDLTDTFADDRSYNLLLAFMNGLSQAADLDSFRMGTAYADVAQLAPLITSQPSPSPWRTVYAGMPVSLSVAATGGYPTSYSYQWWKGNSPIADATNATFTLSNSAVEDSGDYFVVVTSPHGSVTSLTTTITVWPANSWGSALAFDGVDDYLSMPAGIWFGNAFTIEAWVNVRSYKNWGRLLDFGNGAPQDNVILALSEGTNGRPTFRCYVGATRQAITAPAPLPTNQWVHLAATLSNTTAILYVNGMAVTSTNNWTPVNPVVRNNNYIARSPFAGNDYADMLLDEPL